MKQQLITYFIFAYIISWTIWLPLYGHIIGINELPEIPFNHGLGGLGPFISALLTTWIYNRKVGVKSLFMQCLKIKPILYIVIALLSPFLFAIISFAISYLIDGTTVDFTKLSFSNEFPEFNFIGFFIYNLICFGFGEEIGWRGFALPRFQSKFNALVSSIILTAFWALWHLPAFLYDPVFASMDLGSTLGWVFSLLTGSILLTWFYNSSKASVLICAIFHTTINIAFSADMGNGKMQMLMGFFITFWAILTIRVFKPKNLSKQERSIIPN